MLIILTFLPWFLDFSYGKIHAFLTQKRDPPVSRFKQEMENVFTNLTIIAKTPHLKFPFRSAHPRVAPVEFIMICELGFSSQSLHSLD
jgi:hypothetical protein